MKILSLFSGVGGLDVAVEKVLGADVAYTYDLDVPGRKKGLMRDIRQRQWAGGEHHIADIRDIAEFPQADVVTGGFPCQDLSSSGKRAGLSGKRSGLWLELLRCVKQVAPRYVVLENVTALAHDKNWSVCSAAFEDLGYGTAGISIGAAHVGATHLRRRVFTLFERGAASRDVIITGLPPKLEAGKRWPTVLHADAGGSRKVLKNSRPALRDVVCWDLDRFDVKLNSRWVCQLMGYPAMWIEEQNEALAIEMDKWPAARHLDPHDWEEPRVVPMADKEPFRRLSLQILGNAVVPQQAIEGLSRLLS